MKPWIIALVVDSSEHPCDLYLVCSRVRVPRESKFTELSVWINWGIDIAAWLFPRKNNLPGNAGDPLRWRTKQMMVRGGDSVVHIGNGRRALAGRPACTTNKTMPGEQCTRPDVMTNEPNFFSRDYGRLLYLLLNTAIS